MSFFTSIVTNIEINQLNFSPFSKQYGIYIFSLVGSSKSGELQDFQPFLQLRMQNVVTENISDYGNLATCNVRGLTGEKIPHFRDAFKESSILLLQETHGTGYQMKSKVEKLGFKKGIFSLLDRQARGVGICVKEGVDIAHKVQDDNGRIVGATLRKEGAPELVVISAYAPNLGAAKDLQEEYVKFMIDLDRVITECVRLSNSEHLIVAGDFNILTDPELDSWSGKGKIYEIPLEALSEVVSRHKLADVFRLFHPDKKDYTCSTTTKINDDGSKKQTHNRIDYIFATEEVSLLYTDCKHRTIGLTDHRAVQANMVVEGLAKEWRGLWRHNNKLNEDPGFVEEMQKVLIDSCETGKRDGLNPKGTWEFIKGKAREFSRKFSMMKMRLEKAEKRQCMETLGIADPDSQEFQSAKIKFENILRLEADRLIFRSKVKWVEENEKSTRFFFMRIKGNRARSNIDTLKINNELNDDKSVVDTYIHDYYKKLYSSAQHIVTAVDHWEEVAQLSNEQAAMLENPIQLEEVEDALFKKLASNKSPGNDGLTAEFYKLFWKQLKQPFWEALNQGIKEGKLAPSQTQSVIRLIRKGQKDPQVLNNWRPISLMNNDAKIFSICLAERLNKVLPDLVSEEQAAFVNDKAIFEGTRLIDQVIEHLHDSNRPQGGRVVAIDFAKAFDSVEHDYLQHTLSRMGFGEGFKRLIDTLLKDACSAVMNNGKTSKYFNLERSCRQGDCVSPALFLLAIEPLLRQFKALLHGVETPGGFAKLAAYADDLTLFLGPNDSLTAVIETLDTFKNASGLSINLEKCEVLTIGNLAPNDTSMENVGYLKIVGVTHGKSEMRKTIEHINFKTAINS